MVSDPALAPDSLDSLDAHTPVLVGVGEYSERIDDEDYGALSAVELGARALRAAMVDVGGDPERLGSVVDTVAAVRQFETSSRFAIAPQGRSNNFPRSVSGRVGISPARAILDIAGGQSPQHLITELAGSIAGGRCRAGVVVGAEAISTARHLLSTPNPPDFSEIIEGSLEDRGYGHRGLNSSYQSAHGLTSPAIRYALLENARRARLGLTREQYARQMGDLLEPFSKVAATNPHAAVRIPRRAAELAAPSAENRMIVDPYRRYLVARDQVNQAAAVVLMSVETARDLGVPEERWVFIHGHSELRERDLLDRTDLSTYPAAVLAVQHALDVAGIAMDDLSTIDLYSCFPVAVSAVCDGLGLAADDERGLTVTGGLPFFGGPGNNYSLHAIAETVRRQRSAPGGYGLVGANGGYLSKYAVGIYSAAPTRWRSSSAAGLQDLIDGWVAPRIARRADGWAQIETYTVSYDRSGDKTAGMIVGRLDATGERFLALTIDGDEQLLEALARGEPIGMPVFARAIGIGNRVALDRGRMDTLLPRPVPAFRAEYEHILVQRRDHVLEITINRPARRNALHPLANDELEAAFDAYFADPELWAAILTGAGDQAFCAGNDLRYTAAGKSMWIPVSGFGGLTARPDLPKPVIAAINGAAYGGGFEIALACHLMVADPSASFALSEVRVGLAAGAGGLVRLPRMVPPMVANELVLTGRAMSAEEGHQYGLVNRISEPGASLAAARALAAEIIQGSPVSIRGSLEMMARAHRAGDVATAVSEYSRALDEVTTSEDAAEGIAAFVEKRPPEWLNR